MNKLPFPIAFGLGCLALVAINVTRAECETLDVMTFNIRLASPNVSSNRAEAWNYSLDNMNDRRDRVVSVFDQSAADIIGVQELQLLQLNYLAPRLSSYSYYGVGRSLGTDTDPSERSGIFFKTSRFDLLDQGEFWLSETPTIPGTTFLGTGGTPHPRMATWLKLQDHQTDQSYFVINTHWSLNSEARIQAGLLMRSKILELADGLPVIATGDFNETISIRGGYGALTRANSNDDMHLVNSYAESGAPAGRTFHGYDGGVGGSAVDHLFHSDEAFRALSGSILRTTFGGFYPSDHYPVQATLEILSPALAGDYNRNGSIGAEDYALWKATFGSTTDPRADGNNDGLINAADYTFWRDRLDGAQGALNAQLVPEPSGQALGFGIVLGWGLLGCARSRGDRYCRPAPPLRG